eukprot:2428496-Pyramimonas_sp.AAC.1
MVEMASLPLARCPSAICRSPGERRPIPVSGEAPLFEHPFVVLAAVAVFGGMRGVVSGLGWSTLDVSCPWH